MKKVFITGEDGMLAREIEYQLNVDNEYSVINGSNTNHIPKTFKTRYSWTPEFDIRNYEEVKKYLSNADIVLHTAAICGSDKCIEDIELTKECNISGTLNVAKVCLENDIKLVYFSTTAIYDPYRTSYLGKTIFENSPQLPITYYGATKQAGESIVRSLLPKDKLLIIRPCFIYGSARDTSSNISKILYSLLSNEKLTFLINPELRKDYTFVGDYGRALKLLLDMNVVGDFNISAGQPIVYGDIIKIIEAVTERTILIDYVPEKDYLGEHLVDNSKICRLGWSPLVRLQKGVAQQWEEIQYVKILGSR